MDDTFIEPPIPLKRTISTNISNQRDDKTCFAHATSRLIVNAIRQIIPELFYPLDENEDCDENFDSTQFINVFNKETKCSENSFNNLLLYIYIYKIMTDYFGTNGGRNIKVLAYFNTDIIKKIGNKEFILQKLETFPGFNQGHLDRISYICNTFLHKLFVEKNTHFDIESMILTEDTDDSLLKFVLDSGYYITIRNNGINGDYGHTLIIVGYEILDDKLYFIIKNSWGKETLDIMYPTLTMIMKQGIIKLTIEELIRSNFKYIQFMIPNIIDESEITMIENGERMERVRLDLIDAERRRIYNEQKAHQERKGGKKYKKIKLSRKRKMSKKIKMSKKRIKSIKRKYF